MKINVSELRPQLTAVLQQVKAGETVKILERGRIIALIIPSASQMQIEPSKPGYPSLEDQKRADQARLEILRGVNRKSR